MISLLEGNSGPLAKGNDICINYDQYILNKDLSTSHIFFFGVDKLESGVKIPLHQPNYRPLVSSTT